jgi:SIR2-like domain
VLHNVGMSLVDKNLADLKKVIAERQAIIICGAGVSIATHDPTKSKELSWRGLLLSALEHCSYSEAIERRKADIESSDFADMISAAEWIKEKLGGEKGGDFKIWLRETFEKLNAKHPELVDSIKNLGIPIATTNYDNLIEEVTGYDAYHWMQSNHIEKLLQGQVEGIWHMHGHWKTSESVILGIRDYQNITMDEHAQAMERAIRALKTLIFVGCGDTTDDPNFGKLLKWSRTVFAGSEFVHYRLELNSKVAEVQTKHPTEERIKVLGYGDEHNDLELFIRSIAPNFHSDEEKKLNNAKSINQVKAEIPLNQKEIEKKINELIKSLKESKLLNLKSEYSQYKVSNEKLNLDNLAEIFAERMTESSESTHRVTDVINNLADKLVKNVDKILLLIDENQPNKNRMKLDALFSLMVDDINYSKNRIENELIFFHTAMELGIDTLIKSLNMYIILSTSVEESTHTQVMKKMKQVVETLQESLKLLLISTNTLRQAFSNILTFGNENISMEKHAIISVIDKLIIEITINKSLLIDAEAIFWI